MNYNFIQNKYKIILRRCKYVRNIYVNSWINEIIKHNRSRNIISVIHSFIPLNVISLSGAEDKIEIGKAANEYNKDFVYGSKTEQTA